MIKLFHSTTSPFVRKVMICAHELGVEGQITLIPAKTGPLAPPQEITALNGTGKVPCAILPNGHALFDSPVICQYLDHIAASNASLYPPDQRFEAMTLEALADAILDAAVLCRYETVARPKEFYWQGWFDAQMLKITHALDNLEQRWLGLLASGFHIGAIATACALDYLNFRFPTINWRGNRPHLAAWFDEIAQQPSFIATKPHE